MSSQNKYLHIEGLHPSTELQANVQRQWHTERIQDEEGEENIDDNHNAHGTGGTERGEDGEVGGEATNNGRELHNDEYRQSIQWPSTTTGQRRRRRSGLASSRRY